MPKAKALFMQVDNRSKVLVVGNFGYRTDQIDGQTVKTRTLYESIARRREINSSLLDVSIHGVWSITCLPFRLRGVKHVFFLPGIKQLLVLSPLMFFLRYFLRYQVHYVVVGGWITSKMRNPYIKMLVKGFDSISCELESMRTALIPHNPKTFVLTNYRNINSNRGAVKKISTSLEMVFFSRVMREKGVFQAIELVLKAQNCDIDAHLDIVGPLCFTSQEDEHLFEESLSRSPQQIKYVGCVDPAYVQEILSKYDLLVFPTKYAGEGFPGCIVDAMLSGLCVVCTDWKYNREIVEQCQSGFVVSGDFVQNALHIIKALSIDRARLEKIKLQSLENSITYSSLAFAPWYERLVHDSTS
jgi:glycosyltransferase involved in cell wall biosynthesis